jgi:hypothetical protein
MMDVDTGIEVSRLWVRAIAQTVKEVLLARRF